MAAVARFPFCNTLKKVLYSQKLAYNIRCISTSKKNKDTATITENVCKPSIDFSKPDLEKNWVSYGFHFEDRQQDLDGMHSIFFVSVTLCIVVGSFFYIYYPDFQERDWAQREAFIELRRREQLGLPAIDPNYIPIENLKLPSDEELADVELVV